ncbi:MAG: MFS transporter [Dethiobacter sp.]|jgi:ACDE family multidrug resistance protein|nr:MFS transporter [Dethiobacter sp.]
MKNKKLMVVVLSTVPFLMVLGNSMLIPEFPTIKNELNINQFQVGLLITFFSASAAVAIPFLGYLSDRYGRKIIIVPSVILYGIGGVIAGVASALLSSPYYVILGGRIVQGIGAAGTGPIAMALAGDLFKTKERSESMGILEAANGLGKVLSPVLGAAVALIVWYALFFSYAMLSLPIAALVWFLVKEPKGNVKKTPFKKYMKTMISIFNRKGVSLLLNFLGGMVVLFILFGVLSFTSDILVTNFRLRGISKGAILSIPLLSMSITAYLTGLYLRKTGKYFKLSYLAGLITIAVAMAILPFCCKSVYIYPAILGLLGLGSGLVLPAVNTMVTSATASEQRGGVTSLYGAVRFIGVALGPPVFSLLQQISIPVMFISGGVLAVIAGVLGYIFISVKTVMQQPGAA